MGASGAPAGTALGHLSSAIHPRLPAHSQPYRHFSSRLSIFFSPSFPCIYISSYSAHIHPPSFLTCTRLLAPASYPSFFSTYFLFPTADLPLPFFTATDAGVTRKLASTSFSPYTATPT